MGLLDRLKSQLTKTRATLSDGISGLFRGGRPLGPQLFAELEELLYTADLGAVSVEVVAELERLAKRGEVKDEAGVRAALKKLLVARLDWGGELILPNRPSVVLVVGVNGSGKTTSIAKLAHRFVQKGKRVLLGACDTYRAAAADQLEVWAGRAGAAIVRKGEGADPAAVAFDAVDRAAREGFDVCILDTAGRLHTQKNLMQELEKVRRVCERRLPGAPHEVLLVLDGTNGQNAIQQARAFTSSVQVTGLIIAKLDGTARGGALFTIQDALKLPVRYIGTGESMELIEPFDPAAFVDAIVSGPAKAEA